MKYLIIIGDGMADYRLRELEGKTPLQFAQTPWLDKIAKKSFVGSAKTIPRGLKPGSAIATLSILGYDPKKFYSGRGVFEATNMGIDFDEKDVVLRCNLITENDGILADYSGGHIKTPEAKVLIDFLNGKLADEKIKFYPGVSYRHILVFQDSTLNLDQISTIPPHDIMGRKIKNYLPSGRDANLLCKLMMDSKLLLRDHQINRVRVDLGENPANMVWLWGEGRKKELPCFKKRFGFEGTVISAVDIVKGIGKSVGLSSIEVEGATGYLDTNYQGKVSAAINSLKRKDFALLHIEAPDEASHSGKIKLKIKAIEDFDKNVVGGVIPRLSGLGDYRILILSDHITSLKSRTHSSDPVPFLLFGKGIEPNNADAFDEIAAKGKFYLKQGHKLIDLFTLPSIPSLKGRGR